MSIFLLYFFVIIISNNYYHSLNHFIFLIKLLSMKFVLDL